MTDFVGFIKQKLGKFVPNLVVRTTHTRKNVIFRADSKFGPAPWRDWVIIDWEGEDKCPCHLCGFVICRIYQLM